MRLAIDPGHGMSNRTAGVLDPGAVHGTMTEAEVALTIALTLNRVCQEQGISTWLSRSTNSQPTPLNTRVSRALAAGCTHLISIHLNAAVSSQANGTETLYADNADLVLAQDVQAAALAAWGLRNRGIKREKSPEFPGDLLILDNRIRGVLLEVGFISNSIDRQSMAGREARITFARQLASRLKQYEPLAK